MGSCGTCSALRCFSPSESARVLMVDVKIFSSLRRSRTRLSHFRSFRTRCDRLCAHYAADAALQEKIRDWCIPDKLAALQRETHNGLVLARSTTS